MFVTFSFSQRTELPEGSVDVLGGQTMGPPPKRDFASSEVVPVEGQPFREAVRVTTTDVKGEQWSVSIVLRQTAPIAAGDTLFAEFAVRCNDSMTGEAVCTFNFEESSGNHHKSATLPVGVGSEWKYARIPFASVRDFKPGEANAVIWLGYPRQSIEVADLRVVSFGKRIKPDALPRTLVTYKGREPDAPWRKAAEERIDKLRKGDLTIRVLDASGKPRSNVDVQVKMTRHAFGFGTCIAVEAISSKGPDADRYRAELAKLFNTIVFENSLKAPRIHDGSLAQVDRDLDWLAERRLSARGHVLVWPAFRWNGHLRPLQDDPEALRAAIRKHITDTVTHTKGRLVDWDVLNEPYSNTEFMKILGDAEMVEWFKLARAADPDVKLYINDYGVLEGGPRRNNHLEHYYRTVQYLADNDAPFEGIGFQGHFSAVLIPPEDLLEVLERFSVFGKRFKVTELDINLNNDEKLRADYMRDFLTVCFSHERMDGILHWGFWSQRHWLPNAALFDKDWNLRPHGKAYVDLVYRTWWTDTSAKTNANGEAVVRGFLGDYQITVDGKSERATLTHGGTLLTVR